MRRKHGRIRDELSPEIREQVDRLLIEDATYEQITAFVKERGFEIGRSVIGRYGKDFLENYRRLRIVEDQSKTLVSQAGEGMVLEEAGSKIFAQMIIEALLTGKIDVAESPRIIGDFAKLQASSVLRERLKKEYAERAKKVADDVGKVAKAKGLSDETAEEIRRKILGIVK